MLHLICHKPSERYVISKYNVVIMLCIGMCYLDSKTVQKLPTKFTTLQHLQTCQINLHLSTITILQIGFHNCHPNGLCLWTKEHDDLPSTERGGAFTTTNKNSTKTIQTDTTIKQLPTVSVP